MNEFLNLLEQHYIAVPLCLTIIIIILIIIVICKMIDINKLDKEIEDLNKGKPNNRKQNNNNKLKQRQSSIAPNNNQSIVCISSNRPNTEETIEKFNETASDQQATADIDSSEIQEPSINYQYLQEANGGKFMKLLSHSEKCYFRTWEEDDVRKYEFFGNVSKALANINAIFDDVCDIEGRRNGATDIENVSPGTLDSELRIINKAKIKLK